jgi:hypothetical protein
VPAVQEPVLESPAPCQAEGISKEALTSPVTHLATLS